MQKPEKSYVKSMSVGLILKNSYPHRGEGRGKVGVAWGEMGIKPSHGFRFNKTYQGYYAILLAMT